MISLDHLKSHCKGRWDMIMLFLAPSLKEAMIKRPNHVRCPVHGGKDGLRVFDDFNETGGMVCNSCGPFPNGFKVLRWINGWTDVEVEHAIRYFLDDPENMPEMTEGTEEPDPFIREIPNSEKQAKLHSLLEKGFPLDSPEAAITIRYLNKRGLGSKNLPHCLSHINRLEFWGHGQPTYFPGFIAPVVDLKGEIVSVHRTYLDNMGNKAPVTSPKKLMPPIFPGATNGAAIRLYEAETEVSLAEGIETAIAVHQATGLPCWATVSAGGMENVRLPHKIQVVSIWADKDRNGVGQAAGNKLALRLLSEGRTVKLLIPDAPIPEGEQGIDWLDIFNIKE